MLVLLSSIESVLVPLCTLFLVSCLQLRLVRSAGFLYPICGDIMTVPGLSTRPGFFDVDIDVATGDVIGLF